LAAGYVDGIVRLWDLVTNRVSLEFDSGNWLESVAFSPDGRTLAATCSDGGLKLWDTMTGHEQATLESPHNPIRCMAFSPDGKTLAFGSRDGGMVKLWDVHMGRIRATLEEHTDSVAALTFSSDGSMLASAGDDMTVRIWRAATAHETEDHVDVARLLLEEAELLKDAGDNEEAQPLYRGALAMYQRLRGRDDIWTARAMQCLGAVLAKRNDPARYAEADSLLSAAAGIFEVQLAPAHEWRWETLVACDALYGPGGTNQTAKLLTMGRRLVQPGQLNRSSRNRLTSPARISGVTSPEYHRALLEAKFACRLAPNNGSYLNTLGIAHFRVGDHESALATLTRADQINSASADGGMPADVAFIAMSLHQLDRTGEAQEMLDRLRTLMKKHGTNAEAQAFLNEAERVIAGTPASNNAEQ